MCKPLSLDAVDAELSRQTVPEYVALVMHQLSTLRQLGLLDHSRPRRYASTVVLEAVTLVQRLIDDVLVDT